ncbi:MAG TPA: (2Fe-2S)-binding protein [Polyangia bacterium]|jgi:sarcosine oxidase subunit beta|nr:(2Fe-2S)-binding protein [Polyangia bacterium]
MSRKVILCRCEDVTLADVQHAVKLGRADLEEVKRYTGFGTGPCQGKECLREVARAVADAAGVDPAALAPFTTRPPLVPTELGVLASAARGPTPSTRK